MSRLTTWKHDKPLEEYKRVPLCDLDRSYQKHTLPHIVAEYERKLRNGDRIEPIFVHDDGSRLYIADGHHRVAAAERLGIAELPAEIEKIPAGMNHQTRRFLYFLDRLHLR